MKSGIEKYDLRIIKKVKKIQVKEENFPARKHQNTWRKINLQIYENIRILCHQTKGDERKSKKEAH